MTTKNIIATAFINHPNINGIIDFCEDYKNNQVFIKGQLKSNKFKDSQHGFHIHEFGDMSDGCASMGGH